MFHLEGAADSKPVETQGLRTFTLANPRDGRIGDLPLLLRRLAAHLEERNVAQVADIVLGEEMTNDGVWYSVTTYYLVEKDLVVHAPSADH